MQDVAKILGWTIGAALVAKLLTTATTGTTIANIGSAWSGILSSITGGSKPASG